MKKIARIFPRKTRATPSDDLCFFDVPDLFCPEVDEVNISVTFTWDLERAEYLARAWKNVAPVKVGGPALGLPGENFEPGKYLAPGYVITSRGCPNNCWFCSVPQREGGLRELKIKDGYNILDDNLLACSDDHIKKVFSMLSRQKQKPEFTGGLEAKILKEWHCKELYKLKPKSLFFAYDTPDDLPYLKMASEMLKNAGFKYSNHALRCYCLCGWNGDTIDKAEKRMIDVMKLGFLPMAMVFRDKKGEISPNWLSWRRLWIRPAVLSKKLASLAKMFEKG
jgi:hypothetical protein